MVLNNGMEFKNKIFAGFAAFCCLFLLFSFIFSFSLITQSLKAESWEWDCLKSRLSFLGDLFESEVFYF